MASGNSGGVKEDNDKETWDVILYCRSCVIDIYLCSCEHGTGPGAPGLTMPGKSESRLAGRIEKRSGDMRNAVIMLAVVAMLSVAAQAEVSVYEPFDYYPTFTTLDGAFGSSEIGLTDTWVRHMSSGASFQIPLTATSLTYPSGSTLTSTGGAVGGTFAYGCAYSDWRSLSNSVDLGEDGTFYMSALFSKTDSVRYISEMLIGLDVSTSPTNSSAYLAFGFSAADSEDQWKNIRVCLKTDTGEVTGETLTIGSTYMMVVKVVTSASGDDVATLAIYEAGTDTVAAEPITWDLTSSFDSDEILTYLNLYAMYCDTSHVDEFRMGSTWQDVTGVPEPATLTLLGLGALTLIRRRR